MVQEIEVESVEFKWGIKRGVGGKRKDVRFYESFMYDGVEYRLYDSVYMYMEGEPEPFIGKIIKMWENPDKTKKVKILWFFRPCEISNYLQDNTASENELFLAAGKGAGLANINPVEAIAGKCNAVCISKDSRNPQPSVEELEKGDFVFYRTFDVGCCVISEKIDDEIAGVDVKLLFNKVNSQKTIAVSEIHLDKKETLENDLLTKGTSVLSEDALGESKTLPLDGVGSSVDKNILDLKPKTVELKSLLEKGNAPNIGVDIGKRINTNVGESSSSGTTSDKDHLAWSGTEVDKVSTGAVKVDDNLKSMKVYGGMDDGPSQKEQLDGSKKGYDETKRKALEKLDHDSRGGEFKLDQISSTSSEKLKRERAKDSHGSENNSSMKVSGRLDDGPHKEEQLDVSEKVHDETKKKAVQKLHHDSRGGEFKPDRMPSTSIGKLKRERAKDSHGSENNSSKKPKLEEWATSVDNPLRKASRMDALNDERKSFSKTFEVTPRPEVENKSKWFTGQAWKGWIRNAQEQGRLVLLQNLDPSYNVEEVQDIVWHAFKERCSAKLIQRTAISSPYSGQAFVILKSRQVAEDMVQKLDKDCLFLSNGRPLVGSIANLSFPGKQSTFFGHISIDRVKIKMQREMKQAVSTSHCSQPNTVEYDLALDWCLVQERSELEWKILYKRQGRELDLKDILKSK